MAADEREEGTPARSDLEATSLKPATGSEAATDGKRAGSRRWQLPEKDDRRLVRTTRSAYLEAVKLVLHLIPVVLDHVSDAHVLKQLVAMERYGLFAIGLAIDLVPGEGRRRAFLCLDG